MDANECQNGRKNKKEKAEFGSPEPRPEN